MISSGRGGRRRGARRVLAGVACALALAGISPGQGWQVQAQFESTTRRGDLMETVLAGGVRITAGDLEVRAESAVLLFDPDEIPALDDPSGDGLPRRAAVPPAARRSVSEAVLRQRAGAFLRAARGNSAQEPPRTSFPLGLLHSMYLEGDVAVRQGGREVARAGSVHLSAIDDRTVLRQVELRLWSQTPGREQVLVVRGDELVRQGLRTTGRDVTVTTCNAAEPHFDVAVGEVEIIQREEDFEVVSRSGVLSFDGVGLLPIPNARFFARRQTNIPIKGAAAGYSNVYGVNARVDLGGTLNSIGGPVHERLTGRPADEFRGDWRLSPGWIEKRGTPIDGELTYEADGLYRGQVLGYALDDRGMIRGPITRELDGSLIDEEQRRLVRTENRFHLDEMTTLDVTVFDASDGALMPEFYDRSYREDEIPESSVHLRRASRNRLFTATARVNLADFSYRDDRALAPSFREELPLATFHMFSEPLVTLFDDTELLLTSGGSAGYLRRDYDSTVPGVDDGTLRLDEELELAMPFFVGPIGLRPFAAARFTYFDNTVSGTDASRWVFSTGLRAGTHLSRSWSWLDSTGGRQAIRHVMSPTVSLVERFGVGGEPSDFFQFDETDAIDERTELRLELLNRLQYREGLGETNQLVWLDLAQRILPNSARDNNGDPLGLFEYEMILAPADDWIPVPNLRLLVEGEHDWQAHENRTFNVGTRFGPVANVNWSAEYRTDAVTDGSVNYGGSTTLLERWNLSGRSQYDLGQNQTLNYNMQLVRVDHDWRITFGAVYDTIKGETSVFVNFEPTLGGLVARNDRNYVSGDILDASSQGF